MEKTIQRFEALVAEQRRAYEPFHRQFGAAGPHAERQWQQLVRETAERYSVAAKSDAAFAARGMKPWLDGVSSNRDFLAGLEEFKDVMNGVRLDVHISDAVLGFETLDLTTQSDFHTILVLALGGFEESLDVFALPFARAGTETAGGQHQQQTVSADKDAGTMRYAHVIGHEGGDAYIAAALWNDFMRRSPGSPPGQGNVGLAQVRAYVPYFNRWDTQSYIAPAHNHAGFGIFVSSVDLDGGDARTDLDHRYLWLNDSTDWYDHHTNPAAPGSDHDIALS
jgi:hypothetical protein